MPQRRYPHFINFHDLDIALDPIIGDFGDDGQRVVVWAYVGMPRILPAMERCVLFLHDQNGERGGTGFVVSKRWETQNDWHHYAITNAHVCKRFPVASVPHRGVDEVKKRDPINCTWHAYPENQFDLAASDITTHLSGFTDVLSCVDDLFSEAA